MDCIEQKKIESFVGALSELYPVFFGRFLFLKPIFINAVLYSSGNYGLAVKAMDATVGEFSIIQCTEGFVVKEGMDRSTNVCFTLQKVVIDDIVNNRGLYIKKPYKLLKYIFTYIRAVTIHDNKLYSTNLKGKKVVLRPGDHEDIAYLLRWYNDDELNRLAGWSNSKVTAEKLMYNMSRSFGCDPMNLMIDNENGMPIGTIQLYDFNDQDRSCKLGIRIGDSNYWGKSYGEDAVNTIVEYAFNKLDMYRVTLKVYEYNERALRCYLKCGFQLEGRTRKSACIDGTYYDEYIMGVLKSERLGNK